MTLSLTFDKALKWLSSLPTLMQDILQNDLMKNDFGGNSVAIGI